jgi:hypothetical protein
MAAMLIVYGQKNKYSVLNECNRMLKYNIVNTCSEIHQDFYTLSIGGCFPKGNATGA